MDTKDRHGVFTKDIYVESNSIERVLLLKLKGNIKRLCNCNSNSSYGEGMFSDDCSKDSHCVQGYWNCKSKWAGCGIFFLDPCDGYCW